MSEKTCIFCGAPLENEDNICSWCGFRQESNVNLSGTLPYGTVLDFYTVGDVVNMDGESTTYLSYDQKNSKKVLIKEFLPVSLVGPRDGDFVTAQKGKEVLYKNLMMDFQDLYLSLMKLDNRAIQKVYDVFVANNTVYAVLENVKGESLKKNLSHRTKPYTFKEARWLFNDLFELINVLENKKTAHGGISDETVMITPEGNLVLTGFAIRDMRVKNEHIMYKLYDGFSAPEQYSQDRFSGFYTDIYSVAALFFNCVTGTAFSVEKLDEKAFSHLLPKYAIRAIRYATKENPMDRLDNISDFVLMLDDKATVETSVDTAEKAKKSPIDNLPFDKKFIPYIAGAVAVVLFAFAIVGLSGRNKGQSSVDEGSSYEIEELRVPNLVGKYYDEIMADQELNANFMFYVSYDYSSMYKEGQVISHQPDMNSLIEKGTTIYLVVSKGDNMVTVPDGLVGISLEDAKKVLAELGIHYSVVEMQQTEKYPRGTVMGMDKQVGVQISSADTLILYVANDTPIVSPSPSPSTSPSPTPTPTPTLSPTPEQTENSEENSNSENSNTEENEE